MDNETNYLDVNPSSDEYTKQKIEEIEKVLEKEGTVPIDDDIHKMNSEIIMIRGNLYHSFVFLEHQIYNNVDDINKIVNDIKIKIIHLSILWEKVFDFKDIKTTYLEIYNNITEYINKMIMHLNCYEKECSDRNSENFNTWGQEYLRNKNLILKTMDRLIKYSN